ncbi:MAG: type II toxin-antitoxin system Phd/YefM family antitoxin [Patescibacteria group bacterium]
MDVRRTVPISEARKRIFEIADEVQQPDTYYILTENGKPKAVILSIEEFESLLETIKVIQEFPNLEKDIAEAQTQYERGEYVALQEILARQGYVLADKGKQKYEVPRRHSQKSSKKTRYD